MSIITLDFETYYDANYSLSKLTYEAYVRDARFEPIMVSIHNADTNELYAVHGETAIAKELESLELHKHMQVAHNNAFDAFILADHFNVECGMYGCTMMMARVVHNARGSMSLANLSKRNNLPPKGTYIHDMKGVRAKDMTASDWEAYTTYCLGDTENCKALFDIYRPQFSAQDMNNISETTRWGAVCKYELDTKSLADYMAYLKANKDAMLLEIAAEYNVDKMGLLKMLRSQRTFAGMLSDLGVPPPTKLNPKGEVTYAFAKTDLDFQELGEHPDPRVVTLYEARLGTQSSIHETRAKRFHDLSLRGKMPFPLMPFKAHCVTGDTEVLTPCGWVALSDWSGGDIAQVTTEGLIKFDQADRYVGRDSTSDWFVLDDHRYPVPMTHGHTMPYKSKRSTNRLGFKGVAVQDIRSKEYALARCGLWDNDSGDEWLGKLYCAIQADATEAPNAYRFHFKKERKCILLKEILSQLNLKYTYTELNSGEDKYFYIPYTEIACGIKSIDLYDYAMRQGRMFIEGYISVIADFDGTKKDNMQLFYTNNKHRADDVATLCSLIGRKAKVRSNGEGMWATVINTTAQCADIFTQLPRKVTMTAVPYCTITKSGFWLARYKGFIFVTGNTGRHGAYQKLNTQNLPKRGGDTTLRTAMQAGKDHAVLACDLSQIEARVLAFLSEQESLLTLFAQGVDVYSEFGTGFYGRKIDKTTKTERNISKEAVLSLGYGAGWKSFADRMKGAYGIEMEESTARSIVDYYRKTNKNVVAFWTSCTKAIEAMHMGHSYSFGRGGMLQAEKGKIILADGWTLYYDDIQMDGYDEYGRPQYSYFSHHHKHRKRLYSGLLANNLTQASAGRIFQWQMYQLRKNGMIMSGAVHDELNAVVHWKNILAYYDAMTVIMRTVPKWARGVPVDCEFDIGDNYGELHPMGEYISLHFDELLQYHEADNLRSYIG